MRMTNIEKALYLCYFYASNKVKNPIFIIFFIKKASQKKGFFFYEVNYYYLLSISTNDLKGCPV